MTYKRRNPDSDLNKWRKMVEEGLITTRQYTEKEDGTLLHLKNLRFIQCIITKTDLNKEADMQELLQQINAIFDNVARLGIKSCE